MAAEAEGGPSGGIEEGVGERSSPPRDTTGPTPTASGGSGGRRVGGGGARSICGEVFERLIAEGHEEAVDPDFCAQLEAHFSRLPYSAGWGKLAVENNPEKFDVCFFEPLDENNIKV